MTKTIIKSRYNSKYKLKLTTEKLKFDSPILPSNLQNFKHKLLSGNGFLIYK